MNWFALIALVLIALIAIGAIVYWNWEASFIEREVVKDVVTRVCNKMVSELGWDGVTVKPNASSFCIDRDDVTACVRSTMGDITTEMSGKSGVDFNVLWNDAIIAASGVGYAF